MALRVTEDQSIEDEQGRVLFYSADRFLRDVAEGNCCFICGAAPGSAPFNDEHVVPDWILRRFRLHDKRITLPGGSELAYGQYKVPCCQACIGRQRTLGRIEVASHSVEPLSPEGDNVRIAVTYELRFPKSGRYLTFPAYLGEGNNRVFGDYITSDHPEYFDEGHVFDAGKNYRFTVVFPTKGQFNADTDKAVIDICDGKDYFMACRSIPIGLAR